MSEFKDTSAKLWMRCGGMCSIIAGATLPIIPDDLRIRVLLWMIGLCIIFIGTFLVQEGSV